MAPHLLPCPGCTRHVRVSETACPFCARAFDEVFRGTPRPAAPARHLGRAAMFAFSVATAVPALAACGGGSAKIEPTTTAQPAAAQPQPGPVAQPQPQPQPTPAPQPPDDDYGGMAPEYGVAPDE